MLIDAYITIIVHVEQRNATIFTDANVIADEMLRFFYLANRFSSARL
jgi:hypothetical protein